MIEKAVEAGDADVVQPNHLVAKNLGSHRRLFGHLQVGGARGNDQDPRSPLRAAGRLQCDGAGLRMVARAPVASFDLPEHFGGDPRHQDGLALGGHSPHDGDDLGDAFPFAEDHFGEAAAELPVVVDLGEAEVLVGESLQPPQRLVGGHPPGSDALEDLLQLAGVHDRLPGRDYSRG